MLNINTITPSQLEEKSGVVFFINNLGEVTTVTASENVANRCDAKKMKRAQRDAKDKVYSKFTTQDPLKTMRLMTFPESYDKLVVWYMPFAQADALAKRLRKTMRTRLTRFFG